jgi:DNA invertase Pin-like site-specific DNA recombinase
MKSGRNKLQAPAPLPSVLIGYARVSTSDQDLTVQIEALHRAGVKNDHLYTDTQSGKTMRRKGLEHALLDARPGDVLVVYKLDRLSRSMKDLLHLSERLHRDGIELRSLNDPVDTTSPMGKFYFHLMAALAEFERSLIGWRTKKGMESARARGQKFGPAPTFGPDQIKQAIRMFKSAPKGKPLSAEAVGKHFGVTGQVVRDKIVATTGRKLWTPKPRKQK